MKLFNPGSPFLLSVAHAIQSTGSSVHPVIRADGSETIFASWFPSLPHGVLTYDETGRRWEQIGEPCEDTNIMLRISDDGRTSIGPGDDDGSWIDTSLNAGDELLELMDFYVSTNADEIGSSSTSTRPLGNLIAEVYLLIPREEGQPKLLPLRGQQLTTNHPKFAAFVDAWLTNDWDAIIERSGRGDLAAWSEEKGLKEAIGSNEDLRLGDLILTGSGEVYYAGMLMAEAESDLGYTPALVLRPKADASLMWLSDYLMHASEADGLVERICKSWKHLPRGLINIQVVYPSVKRDQIVNSIERRTARGAYLGYLKSAMQMREPFDQIATIYQKRLRASKGLHTELLDDLEAMQHPLPFFLEFPYRAYRREDDHICKVRMGQRLLGILCKVPLYLVVEELLSIGHSVGHEVLDKLKASPAADGTLASLHKSVADKLDSCGQHDLSVFQELLPVLADNGPLLEIVKARNRMHHEPYDEQGFLKVVAEQAPRIMDTLRKALRDTRFLVPTHVKNVAGDTILTAEDACSSEAHFRSIDLKVSLALDEFPAGQLIAWQLTPERSLTLGQLVTATMITRQSRDFGVFDRMESNKPHFTFLRSEYDVLPIS